MGISLHGPLVHLRALEPEDLDLLFRWENDTTIWKVSQTRAPFSQFTLKQYLAQAHLDISETKQLRLVIALNEPKKFPRPVGLIDLFDFDPFHQRAGVGILIGNQNDYGKGYAREALQLLLDYSFKTLLLHQVYCSITKDNDASIRLFEAAGFSKTGIRKDWIRTENGWLDEWQYQLTQELWTNSPKEGI